ncbi:MAG: ribonuclease H family protein [Planctomycetota bacterium]|jgi:ribonuclease HII
MVTCVGIDEAGFGPILGPLVVSSCAFSVSDHLISADLWQLLRKSVAKKKKALAGRLIVTDSKKAYNRRTGIKNLKRTVLAFLGCLEKNPQTLNQLLTILCPDFLGRSDTYPWYKNCDSFEISVDETDVAIASGALKDDMKNSGIEFLDLNSCCLDVSHYNKMVKAVNNKSSVLFTAASRLMKNAFETSPNQQLHILIDRQGGRVHYRNILQRMFPDMELKILHEKTTRSSYELKSNTRKMNLHFIVGADMKFLPVSLASMVSKFVRELLVENINSYFACRCSDLKPTAGYWKDGLRFIKDLRKNNPSLEINMGQLVRCR